MRQRMYPGISARQRKGEAKEAIAGLAPMLWISYVLGKAVAQFFEPRAFPSPRHRARRCLTRCAHRRLQQRSGGRAYRKCAAGVGGLESCPQRLRLMSVWMAQLAN